MLFRKLWHCHPCGWGWWLSSCCCVRDSSTTPLKWWLPLKLHSMHRLQYSLQEPDITLPYARGTKARRTYLCLGGRAHTGNLHHCKFTVLLWLNVKWRLFAKAHSKNKLRWELCVVICLSTYLSSGMNQKNFKISFFFFLNIACLFLFSMPTHQLVSINSFSLEWNFTTES